MNGARPRLEQYLARAILLLLFFGCLIVLFPFVTSLLWGAVLSFSTWPLYRRVLGWVRGRCTLAAALVCVAMILVVVLPFAIVSAQLADDVQRLEGATQVWLDKGPPAAPSWLAKVPLVGRTATKHWNELATDRAKLAEAVKHIIEPMAAWLIKTGMKLGSGLVALLLSVLITFVLLRNGAGIGATLVTIARRIAGEHGAWLLKLAGGTVRGVVYGILGTALVQAVLAGVGLLVAGVPGAALLGLLVFFLSVVPMGPPLVLFPAAFWLFHQGSTGWGVFMLIWGLVVSTIDNFIKPWLIRQGSDMPIVLILFGLLGGAMAFGFIGVFIGPTLLAVGFTLVKEWFVSTPTPSQGPETEHHFGAAPLYQTSH